MATPSQSTGLIPGNLTSNQILHLIATNPELLTAAEQQLTQDQKIALIHNKIVKLVQQQKAKQAASQGQGGQPQAGGGNGQMSSPAPGQGQVQAQGQVQGQGQGQQAKRTAVRPPQQATKRPPGQMQGQQQQQGQNQPMMQDPMRMQQQQQQQQQQQPQQHQQQQLQQQQQQQQTQPTPQQQQHFQLTLEKTQRLQQQNLQQAQQMQHQMVAMQQQHSSQGQTPSQQHAQLPHPPPQINMTAPSPSQVPAQSPMVHHSSPIPGGQMRSNSMNGIPAPPPGPGPGQGQVPQNKVFPQMQTIIDNFPNLYKRKHAGQLQPEQEHLFDQFLSTDAGQQALQRFQSQEASIVIQNNLNNPVSQPHQMPPMTQAQLQMAAQQQLAPLQQQQQAQQAAAAAHVQAAQLAAQQQQFQNLVQGGGHQRMDPTQFQQLQLRQLAQANMNRAQGAVANMAQANALARAQAAMQAQHQQQQMGDVGMQGQMNFGSPRPPQMQQGQMPPMQQQHQSKNMRQTIAKLSAMPEAQREQIFNTKPEIRQVYYANVGAMGLGNPGQQPQGNGAGPPNAMQARSPAPNNFMANNVPVNLHIPPGKQRNSSSGGPAQNGQSPQMRPPNQPILPQGAAPNANQNQNAQLATLQRMINQGIPVQGANGQFVRPPVNPALYAAQQAAAGQNRQMPEQFMNHQQQSGPEGARSIAPQVLRTTSMGTPGQGQNDVISHGLFARANWGPTPESDAALAEKLGEFRPSIRASGRGNRVLNDVIMERMPEALRAIADEVDQSGDSQKTLDNASGLPGQKKRKVQELAEGIDRGLVIDEDIEKLVLNIADEHLDTIGQFACGLAKHRKSDTIDRKDIQVAYEMLYGRIYPAFSSDQIRLDQAKSGRRTQPATTSVRASRMKAVNEHKALLKKEKKAAEAAAKLGQIAAVANEGNEVAPMSAPVSVPVPALAVTAV